MLQKKIRVLVVDDSFFMKKLLRDLLQTDPNILVVGEAKDGAEAIAQTMRLKPDVITMDYNMPEMNGAEVIRKILADQSNGSPAVVMISSYVKEGANETMECLRAGAVDFVLKPSGELSFDIDKVKEEIIEKVHLAARAKVRVSHVSDLVKAKKEKGTSEPAKKAVVIGSSTGGPPVVEDILLGLGSDLKSAVFVGQHMPEYFTGKFAQRLDGLSSMRIKKAEEGEIILNGVVYISPSSQKINIQEKGKNKEKKMVIHLEDVSGSECLSPSINNLMTVVAQNYAPNVIGVILTGMGEDGKEGMREIKKLGGQTIAQDPKTAVIDSMPNEVIENGLADEILAPEKIAQRISELTA